MTLSNLDTTVIRNQFNDPFTKEILITSMICLVSFWFAQDQDLFEKLAEFSAEYEEYELDEVFSSLMIASIGFIFIIFRRTKYLNIEVDLRRKAEDKIKKIAFYDSLTGLPNRDLCAQKLQGILSRASDHKSQTAVLFIDLDNFKGINDTFGHSSGDELLRQIAVRLRTELRSSDVFARISGDEFVIVVDQYQNLESISSLSSRLLKNVLEPFKLNEQHAYIGLSIGISLYPQDGGNAEELLMQADTAMYQAKESGKNNYKFFSEQLRQKMSRKSLICKNLQQAIAKEELGIVYQPIIDVHTGKIRGAEALVRWNCPDLGVISPVEFIPIAEEIGLITAIDEWVLLNACKQNRQWQWDNFRPIVMSVNMSASRLDSNKIVETVRETLASSSLLPEFLELEVTETVIMKDIDAAIECLNLMKKIGISLALDDFGIGYSSISNLRRLNLDRIKIDQSFMHNIPISEEDKLTASTIVTLANNLGLEVTAEGIENIDQLDFIKDTACNSVQGYHFSRPVSADAFAKLLIEDDDS